MSENRKNKQHVLLITGAPGIGKTTVIQRVANELKHKGLRGFYTEEIREDGERRGFRLVGFDGTMQSGCFARIPTRTCTSWTRSARWNAFQNASSQQCTS